MSVAEVAVNIRDAVEADLPTIVDIHNAAIATRISTAQLAPVTVESRSQWLREHSPKQHPLWVAEFDGRVVAWISFGRFLPRCAYRGTVDLSVYVDQKFQRRGIGRKLLEQAITRAPAFGITTLIGLIFAQNQASLKLFEATGFRRWGLLPGIAQIDSVECDLIVMGRHCSTPEPASRTFISISDASQLNHCLNLMQILMQQRQDAIHWPLIKVRDKYSMLHLDVLLLVHHFAKTCAGAIVEIGAFLGGATIAAAWGTRDSGKSKTLVAIEPGGSVKHNRLGTKNIFRNLERNLARHRLTEMVTLIKGRSFDSGTIAAVGERLGSEKIGLFILDADGAVKRDIDCYRKKLADGCWMVIDDYAGPASNVKVTTTRADVDAFVAGGGLETLGFYGWSTWVGRWRGGA